MNGIEELTRAYIEAALWSSTDNSIEPGGPSHPDSNGGDPLDKNYSIEDLAPSCLLAMKRDCEKFVAENSKDILAALVSYKRADQQSLTHVGHDFWLTAAGHGCGFWDGDLPEELGERLTEASKKFHSTDLYVGDDGMIYLAGRENES